MVKKKDTVVTCDDSLSFDINELIALMEAKQKYSNAKPKLNQRVATCPKCNNIPMIRLGASFYDNISISCCGLHTGISDRESIIREWNQLVMYEILKTKEPEEPEFDPEELI